jgi:hypothetical protein
VTTATAAATTAASNSAGGFGRGAVAGRGAKNRELNRVSLAGTLGAGDFLLFVDDNLLEFRAAVFANIFVDGH